MRTLALIVTAIVLQLSLSGCGGTSTTSSSMLSNASSLANSTSSVTEISSIASNSSFTTPSSSSLQTSSSIESSSSLAISSALSSESSSSLLASSSSAASSVATAYNPCPQNGEACRILPLGDSITDGYDTPGGYRIPLFQKALNDGKNMTFVGNQSNGPTLVDGVTFAQQHEGHSYWKVEQLLDLVPSPALDENPHIILLMIGTNNIPGDASATLATLIEKLTTQAPNALLVVAKIIPRDETDYGWAVPSMDAYNTAIEGLVTSFAAQGKHVIGVDMYTGFPSSELADGIHPNATGYARMANVWYAAIGDFLPF